jgi:hypothetical protein
MYGRNIGLSHTTVQDTSSSNRLLHSKTNHLTRNEIKQSIKILGVFSLLGLHVSEDIRFNDGHQ